MQCIRQVAQGRLSPSISSNEGMDHTRSTWCPQISASPLASNLYPLQQVWRFKQVMSSSYPSGESRGMTKGTKVTKACRFLEALTSVTGNRLALFPGIAALTALTQLSEPARPSNLAQVDLFCPRQCQALWIRYAALIRKISPFKVTLAQKHEL